MALNSRGVAHVAANRAKIALGRSETVVFCTSSGGLTAYQAVSGCVWYDAGSVPAGISNRVGEISRVAWDAVLVVPDPTAVPTDLTFVARTATATFVGCRSAARYQVLDQLREGLGTTGSGGGSAYGNRTFLKLRLMR